MYACFLELINSILQERLEREYNLNLITTAPSVVYKVTCTSGDIVNFFSSHACYSLLFHFDFSTELRCLVSNIVLKLPEAGNRKSRYSWVKFDGFNLDQCVTTFNLEV